jgi:hypothetical protein
MTRVILWAAVFATASSFWFTSLGNALAAVGTHYGI